jgi:hypothetical protein
MKLILVKRRTFVKYKDKVIQNLDIVKNLIDNLQEGLKQRKYSAEQISKILERLSDNTDQIISMVNLEDRDINFR